MIVEIHNIADQLNVPEWYTKKELFDYLRRKNYSTQIANELSTLWVDALQGAFRKGFEKGYKAASGKDIDAVIIAKAKSKTTRRKLPITVVDAKTNEVISVHESITTCAIHYKVTKNAVCKAIQRGTLFRGKYKLNK